MGISIALYVVIGIITSVVGPWWAALAAWSVAPFAFFAALALDAHEDDGVYVESVALASAIWPLALPGAIGWLLGRAIRRLFRKAAR